jgi:hypothetical protein
MRPAILFAVLLLAILSPRDASAETTDCTNITSLPAVITTQGVYCLKQDLSTAINSGAAITIATNNVVLDCNDWKIGGLAAGVGTSARGIYAINRKNIAIRNCGIRGFWRGIYMEGADSAYHLLENNRIDLSTERSIVIWGDGMTIRGNRIYDTGGQVHESHGISVVGSANITDNTVMGVTSTSHTVGIYGSTSDAIFVAGNRISGLMGNAMGIYVPRYGVIQNNGVSVQAPLVSSSTGIYCSSSSSVAKDNVISGYGSATPVRAACTSSGNTAN